MIKKESILKRISFDECRKIQLDILSAVDEFCNTNVIKYSIFYSISQRNKKEFYHEKTSNKKNEYVIDNSDENFNSDDEYYNLNY